MDIFIELFLSGVWEQCDMKTCKGSKMSLKGAQRHEGFMSRAWVTKHEDQPASDPLLSSYSLASAIVYKLYDSQHFEAADQGIDTFFNMWRLVPLNISHYHKESDL
jgi:hypothetical protein